MLFKGFTGTERYQEQYLTGWKSLQWPQRPSEAIFHQRAQSAPWPLGMSKSSSRDRVKLSKTERLHFLKRKICAFYIVKYLCRCVNCELSVHIWTEFYSKKMITSVKTENALFIHQKAMEPLFYVISVAIGAFTSIYLIFYLNLPNTKSKWENWFQYLIFTKFLYSYLFL